MLCCGDTGCRAYSISIFTYWNVSSSPSYEELLLMINHPPRDYYSY